MFVLSRVTNLDKIHHSNRLYELQYKFSENWICVRATKNLALPKNNPTRRKWNAYVFNRMITSNSRHCKEFGVHKNFKFMFHV